MLLSFGDVVLWVRMQTGVRDSFNLVRVLLEPQSDLHCIRDTTLHTDVQRFQAPMRHVTIERRRDRADCILSIVGVNAMGGGGQQKIFYPQILDSREDRFVVDNERAENDV